MTEEYTEYTEYTEYPEYPEYPEPEDQLCRKEEVVEVGSIFIPAFFGVLVVCSCIGNLLVLVILVLYEKFRLLINILIFNLAVSDLLFTFGLPFWALYFMWGWTFGEAGCKAVRFLFHLGFYSSVLFLTLMTVQRYMAVVHPLSDWERCRCFSVAPFIIWMLSGTAALLFSLGSQVLEHEGHLYCEFDSIEVKHAAVYLQNVFFLMAFCVMGFCHVRMFQTVARSQAKGRNKTIKLIFSIGLAFFIGWAPYNIVMFLRILQDYGLPSFVDCDVSIRLDYAFYTCRLLAFSHCSLNPVLYALIGEKFQKHLQTILKKMCSK